MNNNDWIRDDWDLKLNETNDVIIDQTHRETIDMVLNKCRLLISTLKQSSVLNGYFAQARCDFDVKRTLPNDCVTR